MWVRSGECCRCGQCCIGDPFPDKTEQGNPRLSELMRNRKPERPGLCPLLHFQPDGLAACVGHGSDPYYLSGCHVWPSHPDHIKDHDKCTYKFVWKDD